MRRPGLPLRAAVVLASALATGSVVLTLGSRPDLEDARRRVDAAWVALRPALDDRYEALGGAGAAARERLGGDRPLLGGIDSALAAWRSGGSAPVEDQVAAANRLEGLAARLTTTAAATPRLRSSGDVDEALEALEDSDPGDARVAYNAAVVAYEEVRGGFPRRLVAGALGFDARRTLEVPA